MSVMKSLSGEHAAFFMVVAETITPEVASLDADGRARMEAIVDTALMDRDAATRRQIGAFLGVIRMTPILRYGRTFDRLNPDRRAAALTWFQDCPISLLRNGFWGLKVLVFMGYYGQEETWEEIGYAPDFNGRAGVRHA
jgi:hypothetical protein